MPEVVDRIISPTPEAPIAAGVSSQPEQPRISRWRQFVAAGMSAVTLMAGDAKVVQSEPTVERLHPPVATAPGYSTLVPVQGLKECPAVPQEDLQAAKQLMDQPPSIRNLAIERIYDTEQVHETYTARVLQQQNAKYHTYAAAAKEQGLTVHDPRPYMKPIIEDLTTVQKDEQSKLPIAEYLAQANAFFNLYGIDLQVNTSTFDKNYNLYPPTPADLDTITTRWDIFYLMEAIAAMPEEYTHLVNLKHIILTAGKSTGVVADASMSADHDTINLNIDMAIGSDTFDHEINHSEDVALCGGPDASANDSTYTQYNGGNTYGSKAPSHESIGLQQTDTSALVFSANSIAAFCADRRAFQAKESNVSFYDNYAGTDSAEDKADTGSRIESPYGFNEISAPDMPWRVIAKYQVLLGRLAQADPRLAKFFMDIRTSWGINPIAVCDNLQKDPSQGNLPLTAASPFGSYK